MAKSERAKELAAKQKAARQAEKLRKKNSTDPKDWGTWRQIRETYRITAETDTKLGLFMALGGLGAAGAVVLLGVVLKWTWWMYVPVALMVGLMIATVIMNQRATKAIYARHDGQQGSSELALRMLPEKKFTYELAVAANRNLDMVHRVVGLCGIVLVGEGRSSGVRALLTQERRKHEQIVFGVPVTTIVMGKGTNEVPLDELSKHIQKLPKEIQQYQLAEVRQRLRALDSVRAKAPLPKGPLPSMKGINRAMRGR